MPDPFRESSPQAVFPIDPASLPPDSAVRAAEQPLGVTAVPAAAFIGDNHKGTWLPNKAIAQKWMQYVTDTCNTAS